jgi:hypothetical protein
VRSPYSWIVTTSAASSWSTQSVRLRALSYNGALNLGVTADSDACPHAESFVAGVERSFVQLGAIPNVAARRVG